MARSFADDAAVGATLPERIGLEGSNPLVACANPLLSLVPQLRSTPSLPDPAGLRESLANGVRSFEQAATRAGIPRESVIAARYILCTFLDETAASTPWGGGGVWSTDTLLVRFHNETWGGEKVFLLLSKLAEDPRRNRDLLELIYVCLALGFEGRYRVLDNGRAQLEQLRERLYQMLRDLAPATERALSLRWAPASVRQGRWLSAAPFWAFFAVMAALTLGAYFAFGLLLANRSDPVFAAIQSIRLPSIAPLPATAPPPAAQPRLSRFLESEIREGLVTVRDEANKSVVSIRGDGFFEPGSAAVSPRVMRIIDRIGEALAANPGKVLISGHTDSQPIRSARFPSNWHLSEERAQEVLRLLSKSVAASRMQAEGRADSEPLAPNDTAAGRAKNRRVEVTLFVSNG
jgi:type VI secretion system protein ImpK